MRAVNDSLTPRGIDPLFRGELGSGFSDSTRACAYGKRLAEIQEWLATPFVPRTRIFIRPHYMLCLGVKGSGGGYQRFGLIWGVDMQDPGYELRRIPLPRTPVNNPMLGSSLSSSPPIRTTPQARPGTAWALRAMV